MNAIQLLASSLAYTAVLVMLAQGVVIIHRGSGVTNFAIAAVGVVGAYLFYDMWPGIPWPVALAAALAGAAAIGAGFHLLVMRRLRHSSLAMRVIATLGLMLLAESLSDQFFAPGGEIRPVRSLIPSGQLHPFPGLSFGVNGPILIGIAAAVTGILILVQRKTRFGLATTAVCENETVAAGMGWSPDVVAAANWAIGSALGALAIILLAPISGLSPNSLALLAIPALCAALVGRFDSLLLAMVGALVIGVGDAEIGLVTTAPGWAEATPLVVVIAILLIRQPARRDRSDVGERLPRVGTGRLGSAAVLVIAGGVLLVLLAPITWLGSLITSGIMTVAMVSVVVLTGYAGQLSLAPLGLAGISALFTALFAARFGLPLWLAMVMAVIATIPAGLIVAVPAFRARGSALAIATLSFVVVIEDLLLTNPAVQNWMGSGALPPLEILGVKLDMIGHPRQYGVLVVIVVALTCLAVANLRRSTFGRRLLATRANPQAAAAVGISPMLMKIYAFGVSAAMAAACGVLLEAQLAYADFGSFTTLSSVTTVLNTTIGGVGLVAGGLFGSVGAAGGVGTQVIGLFVAPSNWLTVITGATVLLIVLQAPDGLLWLQRQHMMWLGATARRLAGRKPARGREDPFAAAARRRSLREEGPRPSQLDVDSLSVAFGGIHAVQNVSLSVRRGEIVGLIGPNGAGKSTFIDAVSGLHRGATGSVLLDGTDITRLGPVLRARRGIGRSFQSLELFEDMSVGENLLAASEEPTWLQGVTDLIWPRRATTTQSALKAAEDFGLGEILGSTPLELDHGRRRLVAIARALASDATFIMLDEPAAGLDPRERGELEAILRQVIAERDVGVLLVEHDVDLVFRLCSRVVVLVEGRIAAAGTPDEVRQDPAVVQAYLGADQAPVSAAPASVLTELANSVTDAAIVAPEREEQ